MKNMKKVHLIILLAFSLATNGQNKLTKENIKSINQFIRNIKLNQKEQLSNNIIYPIEREYPLSKIKNSAEFIKRYDEIFDSNLIAKISNSNLKNDWSAIGWRGIMFLDGEVWLDYEGKLISVNYQTEFEKNKLNGLIAKEKQTLNKEIRTFSKPLFLLETVKFKIRIDDLGNDNFRYSSWPKNANMKDKPSLIISNGVVKFDGSEGNRSYLFSNNEYTYELVIEEIGGFEDSTPAVLIIKKNEEEILKQKAQIIRN